MFHCRQTARHNLDFSSDDAPYLDKQVGQPDPRDILEERRVASASIRGYLYQILHAAIAWIDLKPGEILLCEGDEDFDHILADERVGVQLKDYRRKLTPSDRTIKNSLLGFLRAYVKRRKKGEAQRFRFITTAGLGGRAKAEQDAWLREARTRFISVAEGEAPKECRAIRRLGGWRPFFEAIEWQFGADDVEALRRRLIEKLDERCFVPGLMADRLVADLFFAARNDEAQLRCRTADDLARRFRQSSDELGSWGASKQGLRICRLWDELRGLEPLLDNGFRRTGKRALLPSELLQAGMRIVAFDQPSRAAELEQLQQWCASDERASVLLLTGPGGAGKTRLALEWAAAMRASGWHAGFLRKARPTDDLSPIHLGVSPRLIVIDYAENRGEDLKKTLAAADHVRQNGGPRVRVLLLARQMADWWRSLGRLDSAIGDLLDCCALHRPISQLPLDRDDRDRLFDSALDAYRGAGVGRGARADRRPDLAASAYGGPLFVLMGAIAALAGKTFEQQGDLLEYCLERERKFWSQGLANLVAVAHSGRALEGVSAVMAAVTLCGGVSIEVDLEELTLRAAPKAKREGPALEAVVREFYGPKTGECDADPYIRPLEPDVIGEHLVAGVLGRDEALLDRVLSRADPTALFNAFSVLERLGVRDSRAAGWLKTLLEPDPGTRSQIALEAAAALAPETAFEPVGVALALALQGLPLSPDLAKQIHDRIPRPTISLVEVGELACSVLREDARARTVFTPNAVYDLAGWAGIHSEWLSDLGRREEALAAAREAVFASKTLMQAWPDLSRRLFARSLAIAATRFAELGRYENALMAGKAAIELRCSDRDGASDERDVELLPMLHNLSNYLGSVGKPQEGAKILLHCIKLRRQLANESPRDFLPDLAASLASSCSMLMRLGRLEEASAQAAESVEIYHRLARDDPDAYLPQLAGAISNLGLSLSNLGRNKEALAPARAACDIRRRLLVTRRGEFLPVFAASLMNLGMVLNALGRFTEAHAATQEAVAVLSDLAAATPEAFVPDLALALNNLGAMLNNLGRKSEAIEPVRESVRLRRELVRQTPEAFTPDLVRSLGALGGILLGLSRPREAAAAFEEGTRLLSPFVKRQPDAFGSLARFMAAHHRAALLVDSSGGAEVGCSGKTKPTAALRPVRKRRK